MPEPLPAYEGTGPYVFVSYSHEDRGDVYGEIRWLQDEEFNVWYDTGISGGSEWSEAIAQAIKGASRFIYFITPRSVGSENCRRELNFALEEDVSILAVHLEETEVPDGLRLNLNNRQALFRQNDPAYRANVAAALGHTNRPATPAPADRSRLWKPSRALMLFAVAAVAVIGFITWQVWERTPAPTPSGSPATSIAVMPFKDMSPDGNQQWLADGMAEEVIEMLARIKELRVVASTFALSGSDIKTVGHELDVGSVIEASVRRAGDRVRVTAQLIRVADGSHLWSARYDEKLDDIFAIQEKIARELAEAIHDELGIETHSYLRRSRYLTRDVRAYELVAKGQLARQRGSEEGLREDIALSLQALEIDPDYAQAHAAIGWSNFYLWQRGHVRREEVWTKARAAGERALELDRANGSAHNLLAYMSAHEGDWKDAEARWESGVTLSPGYGYQRSTYGTHLLFTGRIEEARIHILRAVDLDPKDPGAHNTAGTLYLVKRNYQAAIEHFEQGTAHPNIVFTLAYTHHLAGDDALAMEVFLRLFPAEAEAPIRSAFEQGGYIGVIRWFVEFLVQQSGEHCTDEPATAALNLAIIGDADRMFECLDETVSSMNYPDNLTTNWYPAFDAFRDDPRFIATLNRLLPEL